MPDWRPSMSWQQLTNLHHLNKNTLVNFCRRYRIRAVTLFTVNDWALKGNIILATLFNPFCKIGLTHLHHLSQSTLVKIDVMHQRKGIIVGICQKGFAASDPRRQTVRTIKIFLSPCLGVCVCVLVSVTISLFLFLFNDSSNSFNFILSLLFCLPRYSNQIKWAFYSLPITTVKLQILTLSSGSPCCKGSMSMT